MAIEIKIPTLGESVSEGTIAQWLVADGDTVDVDQPLLELETDKASMEIPSQAAGVIQILESEGANVAVGAVVARITEGEGAAAKSAPTEKKSAPAEKKSAPPAPSDSPAPSRPSSSDAPSAPISPAVRRLVEENDLDPGDIAASGKGGRLTKGDVLAHIEGESGEAAPAAAPAKAERSEASSPAAAKSATGPTPGMESIRSRGSSEESFERKQMSRLRQTIAKRLVSAQQSAAILTTFNEIDMSAAMELRKRYKEDFEKRHGVKLGFMSLFAKACVMALRDVPVVNASIDGADVVYARHVHMGVAVGTPRGLVVPVVRHADGMSLAEIEAAIGELAGRARDGKLSPDDLTGGTFTISNGGVYGSLLSTPILNPPQSGILGLHKIEKRPVVVDDQVVVRPMMYVALSYDHRLIDGEGAVTFLVRVKERMEDPGRMLLEV